MSKSEFLMSQLRFVLTQLVSTLLTNSNLSFKSRPLVSALAIV